MARQHIHDRLIPCLVPACDLFSGTTKESLRPRVRLFRSLHFLFPFCHKHRDDDRIVSGNRHTVAVFQLWRIFPSWFYRVALYTAETRRPSDARAAKTLIVSSGKPVFHKLHKFMELLAFAIPG